MGISRKTETGGSSFRIFVVAVALAAIHAAVLFLLIPQFKGGAGAPVNLQGSPDGYDQLATNILAGHGYRFYPDTASTLMREPGYPFFLAGLFWLFGTGLTSVRVCNILMAFAAAWMMVPLAKRILPQKNERDYLAYLPSLLFLVHPGIVVAESRAGVEIPEALLMVSFLRVLCSAAEDRSTWKYAGAGGVLGATVLFRSTPLLFPVFFLALVLTQRRSSAERLRALGNTCLLIVAALTVLSPWIIRNMELTGRFVPTASVLGVSAEAGQYINEHLFEGRPWWLLDREAARRRDKLALEAGYKFEDGPEGYYQTFYRTKDELSFSSYLAAQVVRKYISEPWLFARTVVQNLLNFWIAGKTWAATAADVVIQLPYLLLALVGLRYARRKAQDRSAVILAIFVVYMMLVHAPILAQARYSIPLVPLVSVLSAAGLVGILQSVRVRLHASDRGSPDGSVAVTDLAPPASVL